MMGDSGAIDITNTIRFADNGRIRGNNKQRELETGSEREQLLRREVPQVFTESVPANSNITILLILAAM